MPRRLLLLRGSFVIERPLVGRGCAHNLLQTLNGSQELCWRCCVDCVIDCNARATLGITMKLTKRLHAAATDIYPDIYYVQEIFAVLVFLTVVSVAVIVTFL